MSTPHIIICALSLLVTSLIALEHEIHCRRNP